MADGGNYREVVLHREANQARVIDFTIGSTLTTSFKDEEYAKPHMGGGYTYRDSGSLDAVTRNRFIFWCVQRLILYGSDCSWVTKNCY